MNIEKCKNNGGKLLYNALDILFKKENPTEVKNYVALNQTNILDQISAVDNLDEEI